MTKYQVKRHGHVTRSIDSRLIAGEFHPLRLLCAAVIAQAANDCDMIAQYGEEHLRDVTSKSNIAPATEMTAKSLEVFICSDWLDLLLSWQTELTPDAVAENLWKRLHR